MIRVRPYYNLLSSSIAVIWGMIQQMKGLSLSLLLSLNLNFPIKMKEQIFFLNLLIYAQCIFKKYLFNFVSNRINSFLQNVKGFLKCPHALSIISTKRTLGHSHSKCIKMPFSILDFQIGFIISHFHTSHGLWLLLLSQYILLALNLSAIQEGGSDLHFKVHRLV